MNAAERATGIIRNTDDPALREKKLRDHRMAVYQSKLSKDRRVSIQAAIELAHAERKEKA